MCPRPDTEDAPARVGGTLISRRDWLRSAMMAAAAIASAAATSRAFAAGAASAGLADAAAGAVAPTFLATLALQGVPGGPFPLLGWHEAMLPHAAALDADALWQPPLTIRKALDPASAALNERAHSGAISTKGHLTIWRDSKPWLRAELEGVQVARTSLEVLADGEPVHEVTLRFVASDWHELTVKAEGTGSEFSKTIDEG